MRKNFESETTMTTATPTRHRTTRKFFRIAKKILVFFREAISILLLYNYIVRKSKRRSKELK